MYNWLLLDKTDILKKDKGIIYDNRKNPVSYSHVS